MEQIRKTVVGVYHVFGQQAKIAVITDVNVDEEYFVCDMLNGVETVLAAGKKVPFWQAPFDLDGNERRILGMTPLDADGKPEKKPATMQSKDKPAVPAEKKTERTFQMKPINPKPVEKKPEAKPAPKGKTKK